MFQDASEGFQVMGTAKIVSMALRNSLLWAVPFFVMVSGALLLDPEKEMSYKKIYSKYILRIFVCLVAACLIYGIIEIAIWGKDSPVNDFKIWFLAFYMGVGWKPLWYLYMLIALYIMLPIYRIISKHLEEKDWKYILVVLFIFQSIVPFINSLSGVNCGFYICVYTVYSLYFFVGYGIHKKVISINKTLAWIGSIAGLALNFGLTVLAFICKMDKLYEAINSYSSIIVVLQAICMYYLLTGINGDKENVFSKILISIDKVSLGIYLVHVGLLRVMIYGVKFNPYSYGFYMVIIATLIILILSYAISHILHRIPGVRKFI